MCLRACVCVQSCFPEEMPSPSYDHAPQVPPTGPPRLPELPSAPWLAPPQQQGLDDLANALQENGLSVSVSLGPDGKLNVRVPPLRPGSPRNPGPGPGPKNNGGGGGPNSGAPRLGLNDLDGGTGRASVPGLTLGDLGQAG